MLYSLSIRPGPGDINTTRSARIIASMAGVANRTVKPVRVQISTSSSCSRSGVIAAGTPNGSSISTSIAPCH
jgi:hypothetical protein